MVDSLEQRDEAIWMCPIPVRISRIEELVNQYPAVRERINDFFGSYRFEAKFNDMLEFVNAQRVLLGLTEEEIISSRYVFMKNIKQHFKINIFVNTLGKIFTTPGKSWEDIQIVLEELTDENMINRLMFEYLARLKQNPENILADMFKSDSTTRYTS